MTQNSLNSPPKKEGWWAYRWKRLSKNEKLGVYCVPVIGMIALMQPDSGSQVPVSPASVQSAPSQQSAPSSGTIQRANTAEPSIQQRMSALQPDSQRLFVQASLDGQAAQKAASNDMQKGGARRVRSRAICGAVSGYSANRWIGKVYSVSANGDGNGVLVIEIGPKTYVKTWNNAMSDIGDGTLIDPDSVLFQRASSLQRGSPVVFSGRFSRNDVDCVKESSITLDGSMSEPEFIMRFTDIARLDP